MTDTQKIGDAFIKSLNVILDSLERHRECNADQAEGDPANPAPECVDLDDTGEVQG